jgi:hypothetical protein
MTPNDLAERRDREMNARSMLACAMLSCVYSCALAGSETPPAGPPWRRAFSAKLSLKRWAPGSPCSCTSPRPTDRTALSWRGSCFPTPDSSPPTTRWRGCTDIEISARARWTSKQSGSVCEWASQSSRSLSWWTRRAYRYWARPDDPSNRFCARSTRSS